MRLPALSLFSGAGGMDLGVDGAGFRTVCAVESDRHCVSTLDRNASACKTVSRVDVRAVHPDGLMHALSMKRGDLALLHGGPPCQPWSQMGTRSGLSDPLGALVFQMARFAAAFRPAAVLVEQVPAFADAQATRRATVLDMLRQEFHRSGYEVHFAVLNAADHGVPQRRRRAILVCLPAGQAYRFPDARKTPRTTVGDAIDGVRRDTANHVDVTPERDRQRISFVPEGMWLSKTPNVPKDVLGRLTRKDSTKFRRLDRSQLSPTLRCGEAMYHPIEDRYITPREAARIQGFPDSHVFVGPVRGRTGSVSNLDQHRQVANAVPPPLAKSVAATVKSALCL